MYKILVVDDEAPVRKMVSKMLKDGDYEILEAVNGVEALNACDSSLLDLIVTDIVMPKKHGIDLIMEIKKDFPYIPVIAISGGGGVTGRFDYLEIAELVGAKNILRKPFEAIDLRNMVSAALQE